MDMPPSTTPDDPRADPQFYNRNPSGVNQHPHCPRPGDAEIERILREFHAQAITNRKLISQLLKSEYGIIMSDTTVSRRRKALGLSGQIVAKQFIPKATQEALRAHTQARLSPRAATADDDLFGDSPEPEPAPTSYIHDPAEASDLSSASPDPPRTSPPRKRRRARIHVRPPVARCLITLDHEPPETISKCFLIGHGTSSERIRQFEYAWGYEPGTFDIESAPNVVYLRADIRCIFDDGGFVLLPDLETIKRIYKDTVDYMLAHDDSRPLPSQLFTDKAPNSLWTYDFVPLKLLSQNVTIHRKSLDAAARSTVQAGSHVATYTLHQPPFSDFPRLECSAHPFFVIANAMEKFRKNLAVVLRYPRLREIRVALLPLWDLWTSDPPDSLGIRTAASVSSCQPFPGGGP